MKDKNFTLEAGMAEYIIETVKDRIVTSRKKRGAWERLMECLDEARVPSLMLGQVFRTKADRPTKLSTMVSSLSREMEETIISTVLVNSMGMKKLDELCQYLRVDKRETMWVYRLWSRIQKEGEELPTYYHNAAKPEIKETIDRTVRDMRALRGDLLDMVVGYGVEKGILEYVKTPGTGKAAHAVIRTQRDEISKATYMLDTTGDHQFISDMSLEVDSLHRRALPIIGAQLYNLDADFNRIMMAVVEDAETFKDFLRISSKDEDKIEASSAAYTMDIVDGVQYWEARECKSYHMRYRIDFRGRISPLGGISSVAGKPAKAMLRAGIKDALGMTGYNWLLMGLASAMGMDKATWAERLDFGMQFNFKAIKIGELLLSDPILGLKKLAEEGPDNIWKAASFCIELLRVDRWVNDGNKLADYETDIIVGADGTCSGAQHISCLTRNREMAEACNVCATEDKGVQDVYGHLSAEMLKSCDLADDGSSEYKEVVEFYKSLSDSERRAISKPLLMTKLYGSKFRTHMQRIGEVIRDKGLNVPKSKVGAYGKVLAKVFKHAFLEGEAFQALGKLDMIASSVAKAYTDNEMHTMFNIPISIDGSEHQPIRYNYREVQGKEFRSVVNGQKMYLRDYGLSNLEFDSQVMFDIKKSTERSSCAANMIHSLDATFLYVLFAKMEGTFVVSTHDCVYTTPGQMDRMMATVKETWKAMYAANPTALEDIVDQVADNTGVEIDVDGMLGEVDALMDGFDGADYSFC